MKAVGAMKRYFEPSRLRALDDFVGLARYVNPRLRGWIEHTLEGWDGA